MDSFITSAEEILVIILSFALAGFLTLGIIVLIKVKQILDAMQRIADKAEHVVDQAESIGEIFKKSAGPLAIGRFFSHIANAVFDKQNKHKGKD